MILKEAIRKLIKDNSTSRQGLADKIGRKSASSIGNAIDRNNMTVQLLLEITDALGYDVVLKPKFGDNKAERTITLTAGDTQE
jgi:hypothetical protein